MSAEEVVALLRRASSPARSRSRAPSRRRRACCSTCSSRIEPKARVFAIDTHYLFPETYELWREVEQRYDTKVEVFEGPSAEELAATHGEELWESKPDLYLAIAKVEPLVRALGGLDAWITGVRRDQSPTRANAPKLGWDAAHELWKANPLADWSDDDCWAYIRERGLPYNALHDRGYDSIGDTHSTLPGAGREGRWAGTRPHRVRPARRGERFVSQSRVAPARSRTSTSSRPRRSTSCARSPPSVSGRCCSSRAARTRS